MMYFIPVENTLSRERTWFNLFRSKAAEYVQKMTSAWFTEEVEPLSTLKDLLF